MSLSCSSSARETVYSLRKQAILRRQQTNPADDLPRRRDTPSSVPLIGSLIVRTAPRERCINEAAIRPSVHIFEACYFGCPFSCRQWSHEFPALLHRCSNCLYAPFLSRRRGAGSNTSAVSSYAAQRKSRLRRSKRRHCWSTPCMQVTLTHITDVVERYSLDHNLILLSEAIYRRGKHTGI